MAANDTQHLITPAALRELLEAGGPPALSCYFPTARAAVQPEENSLHLKNALGAAADALEGKGLRRPEIVEFLEPLRDLLDDDPFWRHQSEGLALFRTDGYFAYFHLPHETSEALEVGPAFVVKPLFPALWPRGHFYVLALSHNSVRLLQATRHGARELDLSDLGIPTSLDEALRYDDLQKPEMQHHPTTGPGRAPIGRADTESGPAGREHGFHGHGESGEGEKTQLRRYLQEVDSGVSRLLGAESAPLVLAGVDYVRAMYKEVSNYPDIAPDGVSGSPDRVANERLHELALPVIETMQRADLDAARDAYGSLQAHGRAASDLPTILEASHDGRVETLFVRDDAVGWGSFDTTARTLSRHADRSEGDVDLFDLVARQTFANAGTVYVLPADDMIRSAEVAATFRY
jgi:hypothetical protein